MFQTIRITLLVLVVSFTSFAFAQSGSRSTAISSIGVGPFADVRKNRASSIAKTLSEAAAMRINVRTYMKAKPISSTFSLLEKGSTLTAAMSSNQVDGLLLAEVGDFDIRWSLVGPQGQVVASGKTEAAGFAKDSELALTADRLVDGVAQSVPYRTFITKIIGPDVFEIGMGTNAGISKGQRLRVFDFKGNDFASARRETGMVEVVAVGNETAEVEGVSGRDLGLYQKIAFDDRARGMSLTDPAPSKGYFMLGGGLFTIASESPSVAYDNKVYRLSSAPALILGVGIGKTELSASFAQAQNVNEDLVYAEVLLDRQWMGGGTGLWGWRFMGGLRFASYKVTSDSILTTQLESTNALSPHLAFFYDQSLAGPMSFTFGGEAMPFTYYSGGSGSILFSYGGAISGGVRFDLSPRWTLEALARFSAYRRPVDGQNAVQEKHSNVNGTIKMRF